MAQSCDAQNTGQVGVLNDDPTAKQCLAALEANAIPVSAYLPLNAIPWYDAPNHRTNAMLQEGAAYNRQLIMQHKVPLVLLLGKEAWRSERLLNLPDSVEVRRLPHPSRLGLIHYRVNGERIGAAAAKQILIDGFAPPRLHVAR